MPQPEDSKMISRIASIALATTVVLATAGASMAATYAYVDKDANVRKNPSNGSSVINYVEEGDEVQVLAKSGSWYKIKIPGPDGWVRANVLDFDYDDYPTYPVKPGFGTSFCVDGKNAQFCLGTQF
jgi:uncharacterized protein YraI